MAAFVYLSCTATSAVCAGLLLRGYLATRSRLLVWSGICFAGLSLTNALSVIEFILLPHTMELAGLRSAITLASLCILVVGLIWDMR